MPDSYGSTTGAGKQGASAAEFSVSISFLKQLRSNGPWVLTAILPDGGAPTITKTVHAAREVEAFLHEYNGKRNIYYSTNPTKTELTKKASKADIAAIEYPLADLDPADGEASEAAKVRYLAQLETFEPKPTAVVDSGNGIQCLWRLTNPIVLPEEEAVRKAITEDVEARVKALMVRLGAKPGTQNIDRILRLPGTTNLPNAKKRKEGRVECPTKLLAFNGASYPLDAFPQPEQNKPGSPEDGGQHERQRDDEAHDKGEDKLDHTIRTGGKGFETRSHAVWYVICEMLRRKVPDSAIISTLLDKNNRSRQSRTRPAWRAISRCPIEFRTTFMIKRIRTHGNMPKNRLPKPKHKPNRSKNLCPRYWTLAMMWNYLRRGGGFSAISLHEIF